MKILNQYYHVNIIDILGIQSLEESKKKKILEEAVDLVHWRVFNRVLGFLDDTKKRELDEALRKNEIGEFFQILQANNIDFEKAVTEEVEELKQELVKLV